MNCAAVRDRLPERAVGALEESDRAPLGRHLQWCAACRKEAGEFDAAAATLAFAVAPAEPDPGLEGRVAEAVQARVNPRDGTHAPARRGGRTAAAAVVAAMVAVAGLGWGAVMAGKAARSEEQAKVATARQQSAAERFELLVNSVEFTDPRNEVFIARLSPEQGAGAGSAFTLISPSLIDMAVVMVNQLPTAPAKLSPYTAQLTGPGLPVLKVGRITVDAGGSGIVSRDLNRDLAAYRQVVVRDASGRVVLRGDLAVRAELSSPAP